MKKAEPVRNEIYYFFKPLIPRRLQISLRRKIIQFQVRKYKEIWPIDENAAKSPVGWSGWPDGKKFALVLTHDVDTKRGHDRCRQLARLEKELGFRSSFNFVPERYDVSRELREHLVSEGFEVGVHGLRHDGKYFISRERFRKRAEKINRYMKEWKAVGYRSPSMQSNLEWFEDLQIEYDASTFDTDPFEPQPEGTMCIFPFLVNSKTNRKRYVELPYTLAQDFTLFCLLQEKNIDIWKKKLDWIVEKGGMALLNVHPDYMNFNGEPEADQYPAHYYEQLLTYIRERHDGQFWHVLPKELATFWLKTQKALSGTSIINSDMTCPQAKDESAIKVKPRILMIVENAYPADSRVRKEATALKGSFDISVISLKRDYEEWHEIVDGVEVFRIPEIVLPTKHIRNNFVRLISDMLNFSLQYFFFTSVSGVLFLLTHIRRRYKVIHTHNPPDTLFSVGLLGKLFLVKYIYDHHDLAPELYVSRYAKKRGIVYKILLICEKLSCKLADAIIATNSSYKELEVNRHNIQPDKVYIVRNDPVISEICKSDHNKLDANRKNDNKKKNILYIGSINPQDGVDCLIDALKYLVHDLGEKEILCRIVGDGDALESVKVRAKESDLMDYVEFMGYVYDREKIREYLVQADVGVEPAPDNPLNRHSTFIKIMEYMAAAKPIVAIALTETKYSADGSALLIPPGDIYGFAHAIKKLLDDPILREQLGQEGFRRVTQELNFEKASQNLLEAYESLQI
jgi:glycosyltransferase involved in cell wall biosynthesis